MKHIAILTLALAGCLSDGAGKTLEQQLCDTRAYTHWNLEADKFCPNKPGDDDRWDDCPDAKRITDGLEADMEKCS